MKRTLYIAAILALAAGIATTVMAKIERKTQPKSTRAVEEALEAAGEKHFPERMKVSKIGSVPVEETYYHIYNGTLKGTGYHIIIFDNTPKYLGYYPSDYPAASYEEAAILLDSGESTGGGNTEYYALPIGTKGPAPKVQLGGMPSTFVKAPQAETNTTQTSTAGNGETQPEYRKWTIAHRGAEIEVRAMYVKQAAGQVYLKAEANGVTKPFAISTLSREDQDYIKQFK